MNSKHGPSNRKCSDHIRADHMASLIPDVLAGYAEQAGVSVRLEPLDRLKSLADATTKFVVNSSKGQPLAVIVCSRPAAPDLVIRGVELAESIRKLIGNELGRAIIMPVKWGYMDTRSYVVLPWCKEISTWKPLKVLQRYYIAHPLLRWLHDATAAAAKKHGCSGANNLMFKEKIEHLSVQTFLTYDVFNYIKKSISRLESGDWQPLHSIDHNDFWLGNVMLPPNGNHGPKLKYPFVLVDWAGANPQGYGIYDLIRLALTLGLSAKSLRSELVAHSNALQCDLEDTPGHLLAALGHLHQHLECFPEERYIQTFNKCWATLKRTLPEFTI